MSVGAPPPTDTVGPPSTVMSGRDAALVGNQPSQLYDTMDISSFAFTHDRQEVKHTIQAGTTIFYTFGTNGERKLLRNQLTKVYLEKTTVKTGGASIM